MNLINCAKPKSFADIVGQPHLFSKGSPFLQIVNSNASLIFYGPSGTGKTSVASLIAKNSNRVFYGFNATQCLISDIKKTISENSSLFYVSNILVYVDEIQNFNKKQQQSLLSLLENEQIKLIVSTTESPFFSIYGALISRCLVFEFKPLTVTEICKALKRAFDVFKLNRHLFFSKCDVNHVDNDSFEFIAHCSKGDLRRATNLLEACLISCETNHLDINSTKKILDCIKVSLEPKLNDSLFFDLLSALQKSIRGSDENASVYYLARILNENTLTAVCRRLLVIASEDVGLACPNAIVIVKACVDAAIQVGMPQAQINLAQAVVFMALSPKSNSCYMAINKALKKAKETAHVSVPRHLQNVHCDGLLNENSKFNSKYIYPHDFKNHFVEQTYLPEEIETEQFYEFADNRFEQSAKNYKIKLKNQLQNDKKK